ncbi:sensor histidine kinase [Trinickia diaoshuihuensis]|uniref:sensor histidine kinase n=1 Tax=Trinickia diaoshuihuensis TaxID=2292265 RepID=UPI001F0715E0|nr:PAS domain S-box protein [Trinickia diaoshuihuensis]
MNALAGFFTSPGFMPHGYCFHWSAGLLWTYVGADAVIALSYYSIPIALWTFARRRPELPFSWLFLMFALFILACGTTHLTAILDIWQAAYWLDASIKTITAIASLATAIVVWPLIPKALALPSPMQLKAANDELLREIAARRETQAELQVLNRELELRVAERTAEVEHVADSVRQKSEALEEALQSLRDSETRFRTTFEQAAVGIAHVGTSGRWLRVNQKLCDIVGYTREELLTKTFQDITHPDDLDTDLAQMRQVLDGRLHTYTLEKRYLRKDGSEFWIELTVALVRDEAGLPDYFISVVADISDRKRAEEALRISREELRHLSAHILQIREEENRRIARELHDDFAQKLSALKMAIATMEDAITDPSSDPSALPHPDTASALVDKLIDSVRQIAAELRPAMLDDLGLIAAIDWLTNEFSRRFNVRVDHHIDEHAIRFNRAG